MSDENRPAGWGKANGYVPLTEVERAVQEAERLYGWTGEDIAALESGGCTAIEAAVKLTRAAVKARVDARFTQGGN